MAATRSKYPRAARALLEASLDAFRVVLVAGPRQAGKTTLVREVCEARGGTFVSLDDATTLRSARADPVGFLERGRPLTIDEVQRGGDRLLRAIKADVDRRDDRGTFLLTGSTRFLSVPTLSESLAGRIDLFDLWPLSQGELRGRRDAFVERLFAGPRSLRSIRPESIDRAGVFGLACRGGFPEAVRQPRPARRRWFAAYVRTVSQRDAAEFSRIRRLEDLPRLLKLLAARTAQEVNVEEMSRELGIPRTTLSSYLVALETIYAWIRLPAWSRNLSAKVVRHPKGHVSDSGLAAHLLGVSPEALASPDAIAAGPLLETFVVGELVRQRGWSEVAHELHHFRDRGGSEVDVVVEAEDGRVAAVEVKAAASVDERDFRGIDLLRERLGKAFVHGVVLYTGSDVHPFGDQRTAMPVSALWAR